MNIESITDNIPTTPAITYSECYAQVFLGDCLELYKNIEPKSIDLILTDLPYGTTACKWDTIIPFDKLWEMVNYLLKTYSNERMTILDPCMGSGTTGVACKNLNRNFIGIEKDENYFKIAEQRINARTLFS